MMTATTSVFSVTIAASQDEVWGRLTAVGSVQPFYLNTVLDAAMEPGGALRYRTEDGKHVFIQGVVKELVAPSRFVHTFRFTDLADTPASMSSTIQDLMCW